MKPAMVKRVACDLRVHPLGHLWRKPQRRYKSTKIIGGTLNGGSLSVSQRRRKIPNAMAVARPCPGVVKLLKQNEKGMFGAGMYHKSMAGIAIQARRR
jgi:hypothetical protein